MGSEKSLRVILLPWLAHGHITPFLQLGKKLIPRNFEVFLCSTPANFKSIRQRVPDSVQLVELHLPSLPELPPHLHTTNGLPLHLMPTLKKALHNASPAFLEILHTHEPDLIIYDFIYSWAPTMAASLGIPAVLFLSLAASTTCFLMHSFHSYHGDGPDGPFPFSNIHLRGYEVEAMKKLSLSGEETNDADRIKDCIRHSCNFILIKTFREIEGKYIDYLPRSVNKGVVPVGPLTDYHPVKHEGGSPLMKWLGGKAERSTVYVSFGTEYYLSEEDTKEISHGLDRSGVNFVWVFRFPSGEGARESPPKGFQGRGMVVEWAPQKEILRHPSIAGIVSHCGWGSVMEAMEAGVPIIAVPMQIDQPLNARLVEELGFGVEPTRDESGRLRAENIAEVIRAVVLGKTGLELRKKAGEIRDLVGENGEQYLDGAVDELCKLVG